MTKKRLHFQPITLVCVFTFIFASSTAYPLQVGAQSPRPVNNTPSRGREHLNNFVGDSLPLNRKGGGVRFIPPPLSNEAEPGFDEDGRPRKREGGGSRGECLVENKPPLTALVPHTGVGLTVSESPTFLFYVPYTLTPEHSVEFVLKEGKTYVYQTQILGEGTSPGFVSFRLPSTVSLDADKNYDWHFVVYCDSQNKDKFVFVNGSVRRVERPELKRQLESATPLESITLYATEGIWYEAVTGLAELHRAAPQDDQLRSNWAGLLQSVGLERLTSESFVPCCSPKQ